MDSKNVFLIFGLLAMVLVFSSEVSARRLTQTFTNPKQHVVEKINEVNGVHNPDHGRILGHGGILGHGLHGHVGHGHGGHGHGGLGHRTAAAGFDGGGVSHGYNGLGIHSDVVFGHGGRGHGHGHGHAHTHAHAHGSIGIGH